jgi:hypothetical protein
MKTRIF